MEDAHAALLELTAEDDNNDEKAQGSAHRQTLSFFGVYDGHGGDKVAHFAGENIHKIVAKQEAFRQGNFEQALKDGFLATDRAILSGACSAFSRCTFSHGNSSLTCSSKRSTIRRRGLRVYGVSRHHRRRPHLRGAYPSYMCTPRASSELGRY